MGGRGELCPHPDRRYLTQGEKAVPTGWRQFGVTWYSFLNIPAGGQGLGDTEFRASSEQRDPGGWKSAAGKGFVAGPIRPGSSWPQVSSTSAPDPQHRGPAPGSPRWEGTAAGADLGVEVCVTYVTGRRGATHNRPLAGRRRHAPRLLRPVAAGSDRKRALSGANIPAAPIGSQQAPAHCAVWASSQWAREATYGVSVTLATEGVWDFVDRPLCDVNPSWVTPGVWEYASTQPGSSGSLSPQLLPASLYTLVTGRLLKERVMESWNPHVAFGSKVPKLGIPWGNNRIW